MKLTIDQIESLDYENTIAVIELRGQVYTIDVNEEFQDVNVLHTDDEGDSSDMQGFSYSDNSDLPDALLGALRVILEDAGVEENGAL